jgi:5-formyltetrahydrofolate cyclo-ligase
MPNDTAAFTTTAFDTTTSRHQMRQHLRQQRRNLSPAQQRDHAAKLTQRLLQTAWFRISQN